MPLALLRLVHIVEEEPLPEATSMGAFVVGQFLELFPGQAEGCRESLQDLQDVRQLSGEVIRRGLLCFAGLLGQLGQQRGPVAVLVQGMGDRAASVRFNNRRDPVPDQLAVLDSHSCRIRQVLGYSVSCDGGEEDTQLGWVEPVIDVFLPPQPRAFRQPQVGGAGGGENPVRPARPSRCLPHRLDPDIGRRISEPVHPPAQVTQPGQARGLGVVAGRVGSDQVVQAVVRMPRPRQEVINVPPCSQPPGTVEAFLVLSLRKGAAYPGQADPFGAVRVLPEPAIGVLTSAGARQGSAAPTLDRTRLP